MIPKDKITVQYWESDGFGRIRPSSYLRYFEIAANTQMTCDGPSNEELYADNKAFVVSRIAVYIHKAPQINDNLVSSAWACEGKYAMFPRCGRLTCGGETAVEYTSVWACVGVTDRQIYTYDDVSLNYEYGDILYPLNSSRIKFPKNAGTEEIGVYTVKYSDIDKNGHVNNTNYPDIALNYIADHNRELKYFSIAFCKEAKLGEKLKIVKAEENNSLYFRFINESGSICTEMQFDY